MRVPHSSRVLRGRVGILISDPPSSNAGRSVEERLFRSAFIKRVDWLPFRAGIFAQALKDEFFRETATRP
jgi:hypothetical protein